jgi:hypothetical protein
MATRAVEINRASIEVPDIRGGSRQVDSDQDPAKSGRNQPAVWFDKGLLTQALVRHGLPTKCVDA